MRRVIRPPTRLPDPVVAAAEDRCFQPYVSVLRDPRTKRFRLWYNAAVNATRSRIGYLESEDGIRFLRPHRELADPSGLPVGFGAYVVDDGPNAADPGRRYQLARENGGLFTATSPDGLAWTGASRRPVLGDIGDIIALSRDPIRGRYLLTCKVHSAPEDGYTCLAWTRDGERWERDREPFLPRNPASGSWDRAMSWGDCLLSVGDEVFVYSGGYSRGHKVERFKERQIGLARLPRDRFVSRDAGPEGGTLRTPLLRL